MPDSSSGDYSDDARPVRVEAAEPAEMAGPVKPAGPRRPETVALTGQRQMPPQLMVESKRATAAAQPHYP